MAAARALKASAPRDPSVARACPRRQRQRQGHRRGARAAAAAHEADAEAGAAGALPALVIAVTGWSDYACPWCYLGHRALCEAMERYTARAAREVRFETAWRSVRLDESIKAKGEERTAYHLRALGGEAWAYPLFKRGEAVGASFADWRWYCNSARAHQLAEWAVREHGGAAAHRLASALFEAAYEQGANLSEPEALLEAAKAAGLDADAAETVVRSQRYSNEVRDSQRTFESLPPASGAEGRLPFYIVAAGSGEGGDVSGAAAAVLGGEAARMGGGAGALSLGGAQEVETWMDAFDRAVMLGNR